MAAELGSAFLLKIGDGGSPPAFATLAGLRTTQLTINSDTVVVTNKGSGGWRELLSGAGFRSVSLSGAGVFNGSAAEARVKANALAGVIDTYQVCFESGETMTGHFLVTRLDYAGDFNSERSYTVALEVLGQRGDGVSALANAVRGETSLVLDGLVHTLRPTFAALVAAEQEIGPLFAAVERAAAGHIKLDEIVALLWHCLAPGAPALTRQSFAEAIVDAGLSAVTPALKTLLTQILQGK